MIEIKKSHRGLLHKKLGVPEDEKIPIGKLMQEKHAKSASTRKQANFALNARKWN